MQKEEIIHIRHFQHALPGETEGKVDCGFIEFVRHVRKAIEDDQAGSILVHSRFADLTLCKFVA